MTAYIEDDIIQYHYIDEEKGIIQSQDEEGNMMRGKEYHIIRAWFEFNGLNRQLKRFGYRVTVNNNILSKPIKEIDGLTTEKDESEDGYGNIFPNFVHKQHYHLLRNYLEGRGWTVTEEDDPPRYKWVYRGVPYRTLRDMAQKNGVNYSLLASRLKLGWTTEEAITIPRRMYIGEYRVAKCLEKLNVKYYHDETLKTIFHKLNVQVDWNIFLTELQSKIKSSGLNWSASKIQRLRPDFVLYTDNDNKIRGVIEFDGEQHQNFVEYFFRTIEEFLYRSNADFVKQSLWEYLNIPMLRIRHDQVDMIDAMVKDFLDNPQHYIHNHNTYLTEDEYWSILAEQKAQIESVFAA